MLDPRTFRSVRLHLTFALSSLSLLSLSSGCRSAPQQAPVSSMGVAFKSTGPKSKRAGNRNQCQEDLALEVLQSLETLRPRYKQFAQFETDDLDWESPEVKNERLWIAFRFDHAAVWGVPTPEERASLRPVPRSYSNADGMALRMYFYTGAWTGTGEVKPKTVGDVSVVYFVETPEVEQGDKLRAEIDRLLDEASAKNQGRCKQSKAGAKR